MAFGALAGALNTMYSSVAARATEIATLRAIGFGGFPAFVGTLVESLLLAAIGGLIGAAATWLIFDGITASTLGGNFTQVVFDFKLSPALIVRGRGAGADRRPDRRTVSGDPRRAPADRDGPLRDLGGWGVGRPYPGRRLNLGLSEGRLRSDCGPGRRVANSTQDAGPGDKARNRSGELP